MRLARLLPALLACASIPAAGSTIEWTSLDRARCPAWIANPTPASLVSLEGNDYLILNGMVRRLAREESSRYRIAGEGADDHPRMEGTIDIAVDGPAHVRLGADQCAIEGRSTQPMRFEGPGPAAMNQAALIAASREMASGERAAREGKLPAAQSSTSAACGSLRTLLGDTAPFAAACMIRQSDRAREGGQYTLALELARLSAQTLAAVAGEDNVTTLAARQAQSRALYLLSRHDEALSVAQGIAARRSSILGAGHADTLASRNTIAVSLQQLGRLDEAIAVLSELAVATTSARGPSDPDTLRVKNNLALAYMSNGEGQRARELFEEVLVARRQRLGNRHPDTLNTWSNALYSSYLVGDYSKAISGIQEAMPDFFSVFGENHAATLRLQRRMAYVLLGIGRFEEASALMQSLAPRMASNLGPRNIETLEAKSHLGIIELRAGRVERATELLGIALRDQSAVLGQSHPATTLTREALGFCLLRARKFEQASEIFEKDLGAGNLRRREDGPVSIRELIEHAGSAQARFELGDRAEALRRLEDVLERKRSQYGSDHPETLETLATLADFSARAGNRSRAIELLEELVRQTEADVTAGVSTSDARLGLLANRVDEDFQRASYKTLAALLMSTNPARAFDIAEMSKSRALAETLGTALTAQSLAPAPREELRKLNTQLAVVEDLLVRAKPGSRVHFEQAAERSRLKREIAGIVGATQVRKAPGRLAMPRDTVFVSYLVSRDRVIAFTMTAGRPAVAHDLGEVAGLAGAVEALRALAASPEPDSERVWRTNEGRFVSTLARPAPSAGRVRGLNELVEHLSWRLIAPLQAAAGNSKRWVISPDGPIAFVPFELLRLRGRNLIEAASVSYAPSLDTLALLADRKNRYADLRGRQDFLGIGIAKHAGHEGARWLNLPLAEAEVRDIAAAYGPAASRTILGSDATESALKALDSAGQLQRFKRIHLATHAFLSSRTAKLSSVVMAPEAGGASDGSISAVEWGAFRLQADLVVLSACETGLGEAMTAEGVVGLPYAMMVSGAAASLLSLWQVADEGAREFMVRFHGRLKAGKPASLALRETKLEFMKSKGPWSAPRHWAPYVLYGD